jgi:iron complex transport system substrate-binding protein
VQGQLQRQWSRRGFFGVAGATSLLVVAACSGKQASGSSANGAVTVKHTFGETTVPAPPKRVVSAGFTEQDDLLALGVVPVAVTEWWGGEPFAVWPWAQPQLGSAQPVVLSLSDGIQLDQIAALKPDLIVATNAGVDQDTYHKLSAIAPTIPQSGPDAFFEPWKDQAAAIAQAVFKADDMKALITVVNDKFVTAGKNNSQFSGRKVLLLQGTFVEDSVVATLPGWRTDFLTQMGLVIPDSINPFARDDHRAFVPRNQAVAVLGAADVLIWSTESDDDQGALALDPTFQQLNATARKRNIFTGKELAGAIAFASPLSYPVVADRLPPMIAKALI